MISTVTERSIFFLHKIENFLAVEFFLFLNYSNSRKEVILNEAVAKKINHSSCIPNKFNFLKEEFFMNENRNLTNSVNDSHLIASDNQTLADMKTQSILPDPEYVKATFVKNEEQVHQLEDCKSIFVKDEPKVEPKPFPQELIVDEPKIQLNASKDVFVKGENSTEVVPTICNPSNQTPPQNVGVAYPNYILPNGEMSLMLNLVPNAGITLSRAAELNYQRAKHFQEFEHQHNKNCEALWYQQNKNLEEELKCTNLSNNF